MQSRSIGYDEKRAVQREKRDGGSFWEAEREKVRNYDE
jgi:hypothetical protein